MKTKSRRQQAYSLVFMGFLLLVMACGKRAGKQNYFPKVGADALYQRSLELRSRLNVLSIALEPGYEDLAALAYFRLGRGANILSAYLTNGKTGESDLGDDYPHYIAATRRLEASRALAYLGGEVHFLNLPDIAAARDTLKIRQLWPHASLQEKLRLLLDQFQPDMILIPRDWAAHGKSLRLEALKQDLLATITHPQPAAASDGANGLSPKGPWRPDRVFVDDPSQKGISLPVQKKHPRYKKSYRTIAGEAATEYRSLSRQRPLWMKGKQPGYSLFYARHPSKTPSFEAGLTEIKNPSLRNLASTIDRLAENTLRGKTARALPTIVALLDSVNYRLLRRREMAPADLRLLLHWKSALDRLRCTLLGVEVKYTVSDTALTELQLTYVTIHSVSGLDGRGKTQIYFGGLDQGWAVNEGFDKRFPLQLDEPYRLLTPRKITFTTPQALYGLENARVDKPIMFFIIHRSPDREKSFVHRTTVRLSFAPRFLTEVLTPIVRIVPGERLAIRLKNFSRDGVTDTVKVTGDLATSLGGAFRLSHKEATYVDTLFIIWKDGIENGDYVVPLEIHGIKVAQFAARKFDLQADTTRKVGIISGVPRSILFETLHRMGIKYQKIDLERDFQQQTSGLDVLIVDHRALSFLPKLNKFRKSLDEFVQRGGHLLILAQDATVWNASPLWNGLHLTENQRLDETVPVAMQDTHTFLVGPNRIGETDWEHWLFRRGYCTLTGSAVKDAEIPIRTREDGIPLVLTRRQKSGRITYVNLALRPQLFNIHEGAFRILANLIAGS